MNPVTKSKKKISLLVLCAQIVIASLILLLFSTYLWGVQLKYDSSIVGYERALFYTLLVFGAGFSYDSAKKILFLDQFTFILFAKRFLHSIFDIFVIICLCILTAIFLDIGYTLVGQLLYIGALGWVWFAINSITGAIDVINK